MYMKIFRELNAICAPSGYEKAAGEYIKKAIEGYVDDIYFDNIGNLIAFKKGKGNCSKKIVVSAHTDEVGFFINGINSDGTVNFDSLGLLDIYSLTGKRVRFTKSGITGVISAKPGHLATPSERGSFDRIDNFVIDFGATDKKEAEKYCNIGDTAVFEDDFLQISEDIFAAKAADSRFSCALLIELIKEQYDADLYFVFTVQGEIGARGAKAVSTALKPDISIMIESTTAADIPSVSGEKRICSLGAGAVISQIDKNAVYSSGLISLALDIAKRETIKYQFKTLVSGFNDSGAFTVSPGGCETFGISLPTRFLHTQNSLFSKSDMEDIEALVRGMLQEIHSY